MGAAISALIAKLVAIVAWFGKLAVAIFAAGWLIMTDLFCWAFEGLLAVLQVVLCLLYTSDAADECCGV